MDEVHDEEETTRLGHLIAKALSRNPGRWSSNKLNFLLEVLEAYAENILVLQRVCREIYTDYSERERRIQEREDRLRELEQRVRAGQNLSTWQSRLSEQEAELDAQRSEFEHSAIQRIHACLKRVTDWEREVRSSRSESQRP